MAKIIDILRVLVAFVECSVPRGTPNVRTCKLHVVLMRIPDCFTWNVCFGCGGVLLALAASSFT